MNVLLAPVALLWMAVGPEKSPEKIIELTCLAGNCSDGFGKASWTNVLKDFNSKVEYEGYFRGGKPNGYGKKTYLNTGWCYFGEFKDGKEDGFGTGRWPDGGSYTGSYRAGEGFGIGLNLVPGYGLTIRKGEDDPGLTMLENGELERHDIYGLAPTKDPASRTGVLIPADLDGCFKELESMLTPELVAQIKRGTERDTLRYHHGLGMWLRNNWGLWTGSPLAKWLRDKGVRHPDDMSSIILVSFWRHLNDKAIKLDEQIAESRAYWDRLEGAAKKPAEPKGTGPKPRPGR